MEKHYDLQLAETDTDGVMIRFWSSEKCELRVIRGKFFHEFQKYDECSAPLTPIFLENNWKECFFKFPKEKHSYTSLNFIIKDKTHRTQHAVHMPLDGSSSQFIKMLYGE